MGQLDDALESLSRLETMLKNLGVPIENIGQILEQLQEYQDVQHLLREGREQQFYEDAFNLASTIKAGNKVPQISLYLRVFAEHVARHTMKLATQYKTAETIVDHIPLIGDTEQSEDEKED